MSFAGGAIGGGVFGAPAALSNIAQGSKGDAEPQVNIDTGGVGDNKVIEVKDGLLPAAGAREDVIVVDDKGGNIDTYVNNAVENTGKNAEYMPFATIDKNEAIEISNILGIDVLGFKHGLRDNDIRHLLVNPENTIEDIKNIPNIVSNADFKFKGKNTGVYENFQQISDNPTIYYVKRHNGTTYYLEQAIDEDGMLVSKQLKKMPTGSIPKWIDKIPVSDSERQLIKQKIIELSSSQHADVPTNAVPREHVQNELLSNFDSSTVNIPQQQNLVNSGKMAENVSVQREPLRFAGTGEVASDKANDVLSRLAKGEKVSVEEIDSIPEIVYAYSITDKAIPTSEVNTQKRKALRKKVAETVNNYGSAVKTMIDGKPLIAYNGDIRQDKRADIVIGLPASGKSSTLVDPLSEKYKARVVDSDMVKELLPEFNNGYGAGDVHEESKGIAEKWLARAVGNGDNVVYPIVGSNIKKVIDKIDYLKENGYTVNLHLNELPTEKATGRMLKRFFTDNRFLNPSLMTKYGNKPTQVY
ncbi:MAG: zeta toxin family protein, partial [Oscillospiraceae bacterium]